MKEDISKKGVVAKDIDGYLAGLPEEPRAVLEKLRRTIRAAAPDAVEAISYGMPTFKYLGPLVGFAAFKNHCSLFPMGHSAIEKFKDELKPYETAKGTIRFQVEDPLPAGLVKRIVWARIIENEARDRKRKMNTGKK